MKSLLKTRSAIRHADWPYIIQQFTYYLLLILLASLFFDGNQLVIAAVILTAFLLMVTFFHIYRLQKSESEALAHKFQALSEIQNLLEIRAPMPPMTGWAATPELSVTLLKEIIRNKPKLIVGLGSGVTTLINGYALEKYVPDGQLYSFEHNSKFAGKTTAEAELHGLGKIINILTAPLKTTEVEGASYNWYDQDQFNLPGPIEMLVVDGPPLQTQKFARFPALPLLADKLSANATIIIHDTNRKEETEIIRLWLNEFPEFYAEKLNTDKGITILRRGS